MLLLLIHESFQNQQLRYPQLVEKQTQQFAYIFQMNQRQVITMRPQENDNLSMILKMFRSYNLDEQALLTKQELTNILNKQARKKLNKDFSVKIIDQIWGQAQTNSRGESTMRTFAQILNEAINILQSRLFKINSPEEGIPFYQKQLNTKNSQLAQLQNEYQSGFLQNYQKINIQRKNKSILQSKIQELRVSQKNFQQQLKQIKSCIDSPIKISAVQNTQVVLQPQHRETVPDFQASVSFERRPNPNLLTIFQITVVAILLQLVALTVKPSLLVIVVYSLIIYWLFLGYYDKNFITGLMAAILISIIFDLIYILLQLMGKVNTARPSSGSGFLTVMVLFLIVGLALRVVLLVKLIAFKQPPQKTEYFQLFDKQIQLHLRAGKREFLYSNQ